MTSTVKTSTSSCPSSADLKAFEKGQLDEIQMEFLAEHLVGCTACEEFFNRISQIPSSITNPFSGPNPLKTGVFQEPEYQLFLTRTRSLTASHLSALQLPVAGGLVIGRYCLLEVIGQGGFGTVYLAQDPDLKRRVAIKVSHRTDLQSGATNDLFISEARTFARLNDPMLVSIHDIGWLPDKRCYLVLEYVEGMDLSRLLSQGSLEIGRAMRLSYGIASALKSLHGFRVLHRDLKPGNILVTKDDHVQITDFGLAVFDTLTRTVPDEYAGTLSYMPPEQLRCEVHRLDVRSDIWSLGVILYRMFAGVRPFIGSTRLEIEEAIQYHEPPSPSSIRQNIPPIIDRIVLKCLAKRMSHRYSTVTEVLDDLQKGLSPKLYDKSTRVVLRGLKPFTASDHDAYLQLLPGLKDRDDLPEVVSHWKHKIESRDSFAVGAVIGPSGVGKSSFFNAGLIPSFVSSVTSIYLRATPEFSDREIAQALKPRQSHLKPSTL